MICALRLNIAAVVLVEFRDLIEDIDRPSHQLVDFEGNVTIPSYHCTWIVTLIVGDCNLHNLLGRDENHDA